MKILWLVNISLPEASFLMNEQPSPFGGWLINASKDLSNDNDVELSIAFPKRGIDGYKQLKGKDIIYYAFEPVKDKDKKLIANNTVLQDIIKVVKPDLIHIYGTEMPQTLSMVNISKKEKIKTVISVQGLVSVIQKHMLANLPLKVVYSVTLRNLIRQDNVIGMKRLFYRRGIKEAQSIKNTNHIIGRTTWDKACIEQINPKVEYHFCNETLREEFYKHKWDINNCERYSIFLSQGQYSIKGLHYVLEAMPYIIKRYPSSKLYISGKNITKSDTLKDKLLMTYYGKYIKKLIKKLELKDNIIFTDSLDEKEMCGRYLQSHVFVCPSTIENSPNSLGEAMMLGVPCVASYAGGIPDMLKDKEEGFLYQHDAPYMLAHYVCEIFKSEDLALKFSKNAREHALQTHDRDENTRKLIEIYEEITGRNSKKVE